MRLAAGLRGALLGPRNAPLWIRVARIVLSAVVIGVGVDQVVSAIREWPLHDMDTYLAAAVRLRTGQPLYAADVAYNAYWYAPWFAIAWIPLSFLPREPLAIGWSALLLCATAIVCYRLARFGSTGILLALLMGPSLFAVSAGGNVQPLMLLALIAWSSRGTGPLWVAVAASLKVTPILLVVVYLRRSQWARAGVAVLVTALLVAPALPMGLVRTGIASGWGDSLLGVSWLVFIAVVGAAAGSVLAVPQRFSEVAAATAAVLALPRLFVYDTTLLSVGVEPEDRRETGTISDRGGFFRSRSDRRGLSLGQGIASSGSSQANPRSSDES